MSVHSIPSVKVDITVKVSVGFDAETHPRSIKAYLFYPTEKERVFSCIDAGRQTVSMGKSSWPYQGPRDTVLVYRQVELQVQITRCWLSSFDASKCVFIPDNGKVGYGMFRPPVRY